MSAASEEPVPLEPSLPVCQWPLADDLTRAVLQQMAADGSWGRYHGPHCPALVQALQAFHQVDHVYLCSSGTSAIELALRSAQVTAGDEVILAAYDYKANFANIVALQATPVLVDLEADSLGPDVAQIAAAITDRTRAILVSHLHGWIADVSAIREIARHHEILVIEDACQVPGATVNGQAAGTVGDMGTLSFGGSKLLTAGRGGCVMTSNPVLAQRIRLYDHRGNETYPLSEMQAAVVKPQLEQLQDLNERRVQAIRWLCDHWPEDCVVQPLLQSSFDAAAFYKVPFRITDPVVNRMQLLHRLQKKGVPLAEAFPALHRIHSKRRFRSATKTLPEADRLHDCLMTLHHPILLQPENVLALLRDVIVDSVAAWKT